MIYAELLPDSTIMKNVESYDSVTLVVCPVCANTSVGYKKNLPVFKRSVGKESEANKRPTLLSIVLSSAPLEPPGTLLSLLLIEISAAFTVSVGVAGQIRSFSSFISTIMALAVGVLSIKYRHKTLLMYGLIAYVVAALSCTFAPTFPIMMIAFSLVGLASGIVTPIISTLIGDHFSVNERSSAIGSVNGFRAFTYLISAPIIGYIAGGYGWRMAFLFFLCPISIMSLLVATKGIPSVGYDADEKGQYMEGFKTIFSNRSAVSCLLGSVFAQAAWVGILTYSASFFRQRFMLGVNWASLLLSAIAGCFMVSTYTGGLLVNRFGRKRMTTVGVMLFSALSIVYMVMMNVWTALIIILSITAFSAMRFTSSISLTLEQVPAYRGTMMALNTAALSLGQVIGSAVGGFSLLYWSWESVGYSMGVLGFVASILYAFLTIDPIREKIEP